MPAGAKPGERRGGRAKGVPNRSSDLIRQMTAELRAEKAAKAAREANDANRNKVPQFDAVEELRKHYAIVHNDLIAAKQAGNIKYANECVDRAVRILDKIAPYDRCRLSAVKVSGDRDNPIETVHRIDVSKLSDEELAVVAALSDKLAHRGVDGEFDGPDRDQPGNRATTH